MSIILELFLTFFKIGLFTFGGGYAMLPLIMQEVESHGWMSEAELLNFVAVSESTPGPFAINIATYVGTETGGVLGAVFATLGVVMPSFIVILIVAKCYEKFKNSNAVKGALNGLRPAAIGLIGSAVMTTALAVFVPNGFEKFAFENVLSVEFISAAVIFALALLLLLKKKIHPIVIVVISAALGIATGYLGQLI